LQVVRGPPPRGGAGGGRPAAPPPARAPPPPPVHDTGVFVFVQVQTIEYRVGKALCPVRLMRQLRSLLQR
jgi:hypothetical protein